MFVNGFVNVIGARCAGAAALGLLAMGCGGTEASSLDAATTTTLSAAVATTDESGLAVDASSTTDGTGLADTREAPETLAFAINAAETESYSFTQGLGINFGPAGVPFAQNDPYAFGEVSDGQTHVRIDLEQFVVQSMASLDSFGMGPEIPVGQEFDVWIDDSSVTLDLQKLTSLESELAAASTGVVSLDIARLDQTAIDTVDVSTLVRQFGQGSIATDPGALFDALSGLDRLDIDGEALVGTVPVTEYTATVTVGEFYEAQGTTMENQLGVLAMISLSGEAEDESAAEPVDRILEIIPALEALDLDVRIALDADGRIRRVASDLNVTDLVVAVFADAPELAGEAGAPAVDLGALFGPDGLQIALSSWQEFHDYGDTIVAAAPVATDVTADADALFG